MYDLAGYYKNKNTEQSLIIYIHDVSHLFSSDNYLFCMYLTCCLSFRLKEAEPAIERPYVQSIV